MTQPITWDELPDDLKAEVERVKKLLNEQSDRWIAETRKRLAIEKWESEGYW